jgi:hypothetical protein
MKQSGAVLVFRPGVTPREAAERLEALKDILDPSYFGGELRQIGNQHVWVPTGGPHIHDFESDHGGPVWYIP